HKDDVGKQVSTIRGVAKANKTNVYTKNTKSSAILKSYKKGSKLKYRPYNANWFKATVYINGVPKVGYIHVNDVLTTSGKTIMIDAGHGGRDGGANASGLKESDLTLNIALKTQKYLEELGFKVLMTRVTDVFLELKERSELANNNHIDAFVSVHIDRKSTRLNSSHVSISYAVFCLKKKNKKMLLRHIADTYKQVNVIIKGATKSYEDK